MADTDESKLEASAEKAYAGAAEHAGAPEAPGAEASAPEPIAESAAPIEFPAKPERAAKPAPAAKAAVQPVRQPVVKRVKAPLAAATPKLAVKRATTTSAQTKPRKPVIRKSSATARAASAQPAPAKPAAVASPTFPFVSQLKEIPMDVTTSLKDAYAKTSAAAGEYGEFAKGNVEAFVESGKILASGLQDLGNTFVADSKSAFETLTAEAKELAAVKSPTDFFRLQTALLRRNFDSAVAYGSKTGEAMIKLTNEVIAPISGRVSLAVDKVKKAA